MADSTLRETLTHPFSLATAVTGVLGGALNLPLLAALWTALLAKAGALFGGVSIFAFTVAPEISPALAAAIKPIAIVLAILAGANRVYRALTDIRERVS